MNYWKRIINYEFWPFWILYFPTYFNWALLALRARYTTYFTTANPIMNNSGALNTSKYAYLSRLPKSWIPKTILIKSTINLNDLKVELSSRGLRFPLVIKPDRGERGKGVKIVSSFQEIKDYCAKSSYSDLLLQSYCDLPNEAAFLFYRLPHKSKGEISSITIKSFCSVIGDGVSTWGKLIQQNSRVSHRISALKKEHGTCWDSLSVAGEKKMVEPIGSHNLGTTFLNGNDNYSAELMQQVTHWANQLPGFYYGRFDVKYADWNDLIQGRNFMLMEVNGVNAEPTHIYDPDYTLRKAYRDIFFQMKIIYQISRVNKLLGIKPKRLIPFLTELIQTATR